MRWYFLLLSFVFSINSIIAQRPDSVQLNGQWYYIYPLQEQLLPSYTMLRRTHLSQKQFDVLLQWKLVGDPRAGLKFRALEDSLNAELVRTRQILTEEQDENNWEEGTEPPHYWGGYAEKKKYMRRFPVMNVSENATGTYDLIPTVSSLPDGKYIQYFAPFLTYDKHRKMEVISGKTAAFFELKDNLLNGEFTRFNYHGDTVKHGFFADGLKEGTWFIGLSYEYSMGKSADGPELSGKNLFIDLKAGIPHGNYRLTIGSYAETTGQYNNGYAYGQWKERSGYYTKIYRHIVEGSEWVQHPPEVKVILADERAVAAEGFDFAEMKNRFRRPDFYSEFVTISSIKDNPEVVTDFERLKENPLMGSNLWYYRTGYVENGNEGKSLCFTGTRETFIDNWLQERITIDTLTHTLGYSQYYENGNLFDTMAFDPSDSLFHYRMYDVNGKLYLENSYNMDGFKVYTNCFATFKEKKAKSGKKSGVRYLEGFPVIVDSYYYDVYGSLGYVWNNYRDSLVDGKKFTFIAWDYDTKKRMLDEYYLHDTLHRRFYNKWGEKAFEVEIVMTTVEVSGQTESIENEVKYISYWDDLSWIATQDSSGMYQVKFCKNDLPYTGHLKFCFSRNKLKKVYSGGGNELILTLPRYYYSRKMEERFYSRELYIVDSDRFYSRRRFDYGNDQSVLTQVLTWYLTEHLMSTLNQKEISGNVADGILSGGWTAIGRNGETTTQLNFMNGLANGTVKLFTNYIKPDRFDRRWKEGDRFYDQKFSKKNPRYFIGTEYSLKNGVYHGIYVRKGVNGDTLLRVNYQNGVPNGHFLRTYSGDTLTGNYVNGLPHGDFFYRKYGYNKPDTSVFLQFSNGKLNGQYLLQQESRERMYSDRSGDQNSHDDDIKTIRTVFRDGEFKGRTMMYGFDNQPTFAVTFEKNALDTLFFFENGEVSYYFDRLEAKHHSNATDVLQDSVIIGTTNPDKIVNYLRVTALNLVEYPLDAATETYEYWLNNIGNDLENLQYGQLTKLYPNNKVARTGYRLFNKNYGLWKFYGYEGNLLYTIDYRFERTEDDTVGLYTEYAADGSIVSKRFVIEELEKYDCAHSDYYAIRQFTVVEDAKDSIDRSNGLQRNYFDNGVLMSEGNLKNGMPEGIWKFFTPDGRLTIVGKYIDGKKEGRWLYGDLGDKKYIGEICLNPDDPFLDFHIAELEKKKDIQVQIYRNGIARSSQFHELNK